MTPDLPQSSAGWRTRALERAWIETLERLATAAEYRDDETRQHTKRVGVAAGLLAAALGLDAPTVEVIAMTAPLHDVGKLGVPDVVLLKPGPLNTEEQAVMQTHSVIGAELLAGSSSPLLEAAAEIALTHHERWDGRGYPAGLSGEQIPEGGRIVALVDAFDAMTHARPYRAAMDVADAVAAIQRGAKTSFDPRVVAAFESLDPELLMSPPLAGGRGLSDEAWRALTS